MAVTPIAGASADSDGRILAACAARAELDGRGSLPPITELGIITCGKPALLRRSVSSWVEFARRHGRELRITLVDDSPTPELAQSQREADLVNSMVSRKLVAPAELDAKRSQLAVSQARLSSARTRLDKTVISAAFDGVVGRRQVSPGEYVEVGQPLVNLVQVDPIKLDLRVPQTLLAQVAVGQRLAVEVDAFPGEKFAGSVYAIDPQLDADGRSIVLRATVDNQDGRLRPGLFARVALELAARDDALLVPEQALWPQGSKQFVYVVEEGKAKLVEVTTGVRRDGMVEIRTGLTPESSVITAGQLKIGPGAPVRIAAPPPAK